MKAEKDTRAAINILTVALLVAILAVAAIAAYGWLRPIAKEEVNVEKSLEDLAKDEGSLILYGTIDAPNFVQYITPQFEACYPWAAGKISYLGLSPAEIATRVSSEFLAGHVQVDVMNDPLITISGAFQQGAAQNYTNPMNVLMNYTSYDPAGIWQVGFLSPMVLLYNTNLVNASNVPTSYQDLANPKFKGSVVISDPKTLSASGGLFGTLYPILGNASWYTLMNGIVANNPVIASSAGECYTKLSSGEAAIGIAGLNDYMNGKKMTPPAPVEAVWTALPIVASPIVNALATNAPHPNFGKLWIQWFASNSGQFACASAGRVPWHATLASATVLAGVMPAGTTMMPLGTNNPDYYSNTTKWKAIFQQIFG